jgi:hypothetical protein
MNAIKNDNIALYNGLIYEKKNNKNKKVVTFDLDDTIGSFSHLHILWKGVNRFIDKNYNKKNELFFQIFDLYPEFLRCNILNILKFLNHKKDTNKIHLYLYTNNQCETPWITYITDYIEYKLKLKKPIFDKIIYAFKIKNKRIEPNRTGHNKTYDDFINCVMIPKSTEICFIDDSFHQEMIHNKVYYIQPKAYFHGLQINLIISRFIDSTIGKECIDLSTLKHNYISFLYDWFEFNHAKKYIPKTYTYDIKNEKKTSKKLLYYIKDFIYTSNYNNKTKKNRIKTNFTRKKY